MSSLPKAIVDQLLRQIDQKLKHRHDSREGCRSINTDMQIVSRVRTLPPFKIQSRAMVRNLNAQFLQGKTVAQILAGHSHVEADITDLLHDAAKIKGKTVDDSAIADGKVLVYRVAGTKLQYEDQAAAAPPSLTRTLMLMGG